MNALGGQSTAFHRSHNTFKSVDDFAAKASEHQSRLEAIDRALSQPGAPILAINPGSLRSYRRDDSTIRYAIKRSDGSGLDIRQAWNDGQKWHYHWATALEEERRTGRSIYRGFGGGGPSEALISNITTNSLVAACFDPAEAAGVVGSELDGKVSRIYVIGEDDMTVFFDEGMRMSFDQRFDMLRGAVAFAGIIL